MYQLYKKAGDALLLNFDFASKFGVDNAGRHKALREALRAVGNASDLAEAVALAGAALNDDDDTLGRGISQLTSAVSAPESLTIEKIGVDGLVAQVKVSGGVAGVSYVVTCQVLLDTDEIVLLDGYVDVEA